MARCMLCASAVGEGDSVCPHCGGAVEADDATHVESPPDPTWATPAPAGPPGPFGPQPPAGGWAPPAAAPSPWGGAPGPAPAPQGYGYGDAAPQGYGYGTPAPYGYGWTPPRRTEGLATAALITSVVGLVTAFMCWLPILACPVGAVLGHVALRRIAESGDEGRGMALAGVIVGWIGTGLLLLGIGLIVAIAAGSA